MGVSSFAARRAWPSTSSQVIGSSYQSGQGGRVVPALVGVHGQPDVLAEHVADPLQAPGVLLGIEADLDLEAHALLDVGPRGVEDLVGAQVQPAGVGAVGGRRGAGAAEEFVQRQPGGLALEVPQGHVHRRVRLPHQPAPPDGLQGPVGLPLQTLVVERVLADDQRRQVVGGDGEQAAAAALEGVGEAEAGQAGVGVEAQQQDDDVVEPPGGGLQERGARPRQRHVQQLPVGAGDAHGGSLT